MMAFRHQLPAYSPLSLADLISAVRGMTANGEEAERQLTGFLRNTFAAEEVVLTGSGTQAQEPMLEERSVETDMNLPQAPAGVALALELGDH